MTLTPSRRGIRYGAFPSPPNAKMLGFPSHLVQRLGEFPVRGSIQPGPSGVKRVGPTKNQKQQGSCTGHGASSLGETLYRVIGQTPIFSPAYPYYLERKSEGTLEQGDCGAQVETSLAISNKYGFCPIEYMPYNPDDCETAPSQAAYDAAKKFPGGAYHSLGNVIANIKSCVLSKPYGYSGVIGISVYQSFEDDDVAKSGLIPYPNPGVEPLLGGHETHSIIGFDDTIQCPNSPNPGAVLGQNSWGTEWGVKCPFDGLSDDDGGFYWLSYDYLMNVNFCSDVRMLHLGAAW